MSAFTMDDLRRVMKAAVGVDDSVDLEADILDVGFTELGYDSLAMLEIASKIEKEFPARLPDDAVGDLRTPRLLVDHVNTQLAGVAS
jgi:act minimal PKS acyl carrier protein